LAEKLQNYFPDYKVDCEYNRHGDETKRLQYPFRRVILQPDDLDAKTVYPDIIIHQRGHDNDNLVVIEVKTNRSHENTSKDEEKLKAFTRPEYNYRIGLSLVFDLGMKKIADVKYFENGDTKTTIDISSLKEINRNE
jgi:hypothetical protein